MSATPIPAAPTLPPTARDFDIHKMHVVYHASTRTIAEKHGISQTRVRQVVTRVGDWLAEALPAKTEAQEEQQARLARHLAADQFCHQLQELRSLWDGTHDPKYLRQQTRVITALARLGIVPGAIDALAADVTAGPIDPNEPQQPWSEDDPWANRASQSEISNLQSEIPAPPPSEGCSPLPEPQPVPSAAFEDRDAVTASLSDTSNELPQPNQPELQVPDIVEQHLLTCLENVAPEDDERRESLSQTLHSIRDSKATLELRLSGNSAPLIAK